MKTISPCLLILCCWTVLGSVGIAADFHVTTHVFQGNARVPVVSYQTIFRKNVVYDIATTHPRQVTVVDYASGKITLLDLQRQVKLEMDTQQVLEHSAYFKSHGEFRGPLLEFLKNPEFQVKFAADTSTLTMSGGPLNYEIALQPINNQAVADEYARFCDWSAQLNFVCAGGDPPQARIEVNSQIRAKAAVPQEIRKTIRNANPADAVMLRSTHEFRWELNDSDQRMIESLRHDLTQAKAVNYADYVRR